MPSSSITRRSRDTHCPICPARRHSSSSDTAPEAPPQFVNANGVAYTRGGGGYDGANRPLGGSYKKTQNGSPFTIHCISQDIPGLSWCFGCSHMPFVRSVKRSMSRPGSSGKWFARTSVVSCVVAVAGGTPVGQPAAPKNCPDTARVITASLPRVLNTVAAKGESTKKTMCFMVQNKFSTSEEKHLCTLPASTRTGHQMAPWIRDSAR